MRTVSRILVASMLCVTVSPALATPDEEVRDIVAAWEQAYTAGDYNKISQFYDRYARLHGVDTADMIGPEAISEHYYFENWRNAPRSVKLSDIKCYAYDDATATCAGGMEFVATRRSGETLSQPSQVSLAFAYDHDVGRWLIHDHRVLRGIAVAVKPAPSLQADAVQPSLSSVPASAATIPVQ
jgi:ketosteroid isomerase-like protein